MTRAEREAYDAALDGDSEPCPACGSTATPGHGPCSDACAAEMERRERRADIAAEWAEDDLVSRYRAAHAEVAEPDADWMAGG